MKRILAVMASGVIALSLAAPAGAQATYFAAPSCYDQATGTPIPCHVNMHNFGGPVMTNPTSIYNIWYGSSAVSTSNTLTGFFSNLTGSNYINIASLFGATTTINFSGNVFESAYLGNSLSDSQLGQIVNDAINQGQVASSSNAIYNIITAPGISEQSDGAACAFHSDVNSLKYTWIGSSFTSGHGCGSHSFDQNLISAASHELMETLTDPLVGQAAFFGPPLGWYDNGGTNQGENGDMCNQKSFDTNLGGNPYYVQSIFVNDAGYAAGGFCASGLQQNATPTPEPASLVLLATGLLGLVAVRRRMAR